MNKLQFFLAAMRAGEYRRRAWVISAFAATREKPEAWRADPYPYRIVQTAEGHFFVNPQNTQELLPLESNAAPGEAPFRFKAKLRLPAGLVPNLPEAAETTYGNLLFNYTALIYAFGEKFPYQHGRVSAKKLEQQILLRLKDEDDPQAKQWGGTGRDPKWLYVDELLRFTDAMFYLAGFAQLCVPANTKKTMTAAPGIVELKEKLLRENKDRLHDAAVVAQIQSKLVAYDRAYMKGDLGEGFLITDKSFQNVRSKLYGMHGAEMGLDESVNVDVITNSLSQGWDISKFPAMLNSLRAGSFNRGAQTMLGGESVKWLLRASSNISVTQADCGSRLGNEVQVTADNLDWITGFSVVTPEGSVRVTPDTAGSYIGQKLVLRSPMFCKLKMTDFCTVCVGERLALNPEGLSSAVSQYGSAFLSLFMAAAHSKALTVAKLDFKQAIT